MNDLEDEQYAVASKMTGVGPTLHPALSPRQMKFIDNYFDATCPTFGNAYRSALAAGYTEETSRNITHNRPRWLSEKLGQTNIMEPELLLLKLVSIINSPSEQTRNKLKAIDMMMKHYQMFQDKKVYNNVQINIQSVLD